jgi:hypothetical protein
MNRLKALLSSCRRLSEFHFNGEDCEMQAVPSMIRFLVGGDRQESITYTSQSKITVLDILDSQHSSQRTTRSISVGASLTYVPVYSC